MPQVPSHGSNGTFWRGADGNVWVAGSDGTNSAGKWDDNTFNYWDTQGYALQNDPTGQFNPLSGGTDTPYPRNDSTGGTGSSAAANSQISYIDQLLGNISAKKKYGLDKLEDEYRLAKKRLGEDKTRTFSGYDKQSLENAQNKERGVSQVDSFANSSYNNLQRILQGGNAGNSSVGKYLVPQLVSKAAGSRRQGVFDTAGRNESDIVEARDDATLQFNRNEEDNARGYKETRRNFITGIDEAQQDLLSKKLAFQQDNGLATGATEAELARRSAALDSLFGNYKTTFNKNAYNFKNPELSQYTVDPATLRYNQQGPSETRAYLPALQKKKQLEQGA